ncbi:hypothetical protein LguiA_033849 [Lonicera macranthoides]
MAEEQEQEESQPQEQQNPTILSPSSSTPQDHHHYQKLLSSYLGLSFTLFLNFFPSLQTQNKSLSIKLIQAQKQLKELNSRRKEDSKANARVVEIFASHRHSWMEEEKRLLGRIDQGEQEIKNLRGRVQELERVEVELKEDLEGLRREVCERDEMLGFLGGGGGGGRDFCGELEAGEGRWGKVRACEEEMGYGEDRGGGYNGDGVGEIEGGYGGINGFNPEFSSSVSKFLAERASLWQDVQYESVENLYNLKHFVARRESPWKVDGESTGVSAKLKLLEQELSNFERIGKSDLSKVPSLMKKQAKRYQALAGKIDDLCQRMQASDPCEPTLTPEFRTQRQTEFLIEAFRLQQRASETGQKLMALQTETGKSYFGDELEGQAKLTTRRCMESIRNSFKEIQRNLEIWLARIIGDVEGILARDGASRAREYYVSGYPFVQ